ncbi:hypothetical protein [Clostridioides difficile]|uniref:hypothetical protein n=1 Tax=Clostridioides difficile TaxID=1496 RepID=UPI0002359CDA|nr:hypothetical protein [Clostridioides difficile]AYD21243.1 hypothetical protein DA434_08345 [Clostridioides difficile]EGT4231923.1 hypothetical protein [Clostridioides difficile]EGT4849696.1 hypothetical protein [Clostridioides difficile]EGT5400131.1 hypothetical protein [Clostridioides difficile]EHJ26284.1 hypothetical protein HMPREF1122_03045 [Clostridioides difficile 002-P50-2011]
MELFLQFAWGMKQMVLDLSKDWSGATTILSPRDISPNQLERWVKEFKKANVKTLFDPQCYYPKCNHKNLVQYNYWDSSFSTKMQGSFSFEDELIKSILYYNNIAETHEFIIPSNMLTHDEKWFSRWLKNSEQLVNSARKIVRDRKIILTLAIPDSVLLQKEDEVEKIIEATEKLDVDGYYIIAHPPQDKYLVDVPMWLINLTQLCAGLKLQSRKVIMGYGNHQLLCLTATGIDAMATGTYLNVRRFTNKFEEDDSIKRKSIWYYYPAALSEYKMGFLDAAYNNGVLQQMRPAKEMDRGYVDLIFSDVLPSSTAFKEPMAFKHYLNCVKVQMKSLLKQTYKETITANEIMLENAMRRIEYMEKSGVYAQGRSFKDMVDVNMSALQRLDKNRGFQLQQEWNNF